MKEQKVKSKPTLKVFSRMDPKLGLGHATEKNEFLEVWESISKKRRRSGDHGSAEKHLKCA
jgi:hypothetical protein